MSPKKQPKSIIKILMPDGSIIETEVVLTLDNVGDPKKTIFRMHGASPQMLLSAKDALIVQGGYKTDSIVYYAPTAFGAEKAIAAVNGVYADRLRKLEETINQLRKYKGSSSELRLAYDNAQKEIFDLKRKINFLARIAKTGTGLPVQNGNIDTVSRQEYSDLEKRLTQSEQLNRNYQDQLGIFEKELLEKEREVEMLSEELLKSISPAQHSSEMERLKDEYNGVNQRAINAQPALITKNGSRRYLDLEGILQLKSDEKEGLVEGQHVLVITKNGGLRVYIGRLYFNDTKDYICLGQGLDITRLFPDLDKKVEINEEELTKRIKSDNIHIPTYLMAVKDLAHQIIQLWLHNIKPEQEIKIISIDDTIKDLLDDMEIVISTQDYFAQETQIPELKLVEERIKEEENTFVFYELIKRYLDSTPDFIPKIEQAKKAKTEEDRNFILLSMKLEQNRRIIKLVENILEFINSEYFKPCDIGIIHTHPKIREIRERYNGAVNFLRSIDQSYVERLAKKKDMITSLTDLGILNNYWNLFYQKNPAKK